MSVHPHNLREAAAWVADLEKEVERLLAENERLKEELGGMLADLQQERGYE